MNKILIILIFLGCISGLSSLIQLNGSLDLGGTIKYFPVEEANEEMKINAGITPGFEYLIQKQNYIYGAGIEIQFPRGYNETKTYKEATFNYIPIYCAGKYQLREYKFKPEIDLQLGYNFMSGSTAFKGDNILSGGLYYGFGASASYKDFVFSAMYKMHKGNLDIAHTVWTGNGNLILTETKTKITYSHLSLIIGYRISK